MTSDSVSSFLDQARVYRLLQPDLLDDLFQQQSFPRQNLTAVCDALLERGALTKYQVEMVRAGNRAGLTFAGYPILEEIGRFPGGTLFKALHPSLRTPLHLRRYLPSWIGPFDTTTSFIQRAQAAAPIIHDHLCHLLDAGIYRDEPFAVLEPFDGSDAAKLVGDIGPMPHLLAMEYGRQIAEAIRVVHEKGLVHGHIRPEVVFAGPLVPMSKRRSDGKERFRPGPTAKVKLFELGLTPIRPPAERWEAERIGPLEGIAYLAPERMDAVEPTAAGDVYSLGAVLYFLLTGRPPRSGDTTDAMVQSTRKGKAPLLGLIRPDVPATLVSLCQAMMTKTPADRPSIAEVLNRLSPHSGATTEPVAASSNPHAAAPIGPPPVNLESLAGAPTRINEQGPVTAIALESPPIEKPRPSSAIPQSEIMRVGPPVKGESEWYIVPLSDSKQDVPTIVAPEYRGPIPDATPIESTEPQSSSRSRRGTLSGSSRSVRRRGQTEASTGKVWFWFAVGAGLWILAVLLWFVYFLSTRAPSSSGHP